MTYIEFFDNNEAENICACLTGTPEKVILIGDSEQMLKTHAERYRHLFLNRGIEIEFICEEVDKNNLSEIVDLLCGIVEEYEDCAFDLTGGGDLFLVATGIVYYRYRDMDLQLHRFNILNNRVYDCDNDGNFISINNLPRLTVEENIMLFGGSLVFESERGGTTVRWDWTEDFRKDILAMWDICRIDVSMWNTQVGIFAAIAGFNHSESLKCTADIGSLKKLLESAGTKYKMIPRIINGLVKLGLITADTSAADRIVLTFKNGQIKKCLTKAGQILEMVVTTAAMEAIGDDGDPVYNDVVNGAYIDWDGDVHTQKGFYDTHNEIDVLMMHEMIPVFVSCKNGSFEIDELYKLDSVASRFGGKYVKKALITSAMGKNSRRAGYIRQRAKDMGICLIENPQKMSGGKLKRIMGTLWQSEPCGTTR